MRAYSPPSRRLAEELGCHRARVSRALKTASVLLGEHWIARLVRPRMYEINGTSGGPPCGGVRRRDASAKAIPRAERLDPGDVGADGLYQGMFAQRDPPERHMPVLIRRKESAGSGSGPNRSTRRENWFVKRPRARAVAA